MTTNNNKKIILIKINKMEKSNIRCSIPQWYYGLRALVGEKGLVAEKTEVKARGLKLRKDMGHYYKKKNN